MKITFRTVTLALAVVAALLLVLPVGAQQSVYYGSGGTSYTNLFQGTNTLEQRNGTNAQSLFLYSTYTDASNYERAALNATTSRIELRAEKAGTGSDRDLILRSNSNITFKDGNDNTRMSLTGIGTNFGMQMSAVAFASLPALSNGSILYCSDCTIAAVCAGAGTGAIGKRLNGVWVCN